MPYGVIRVLPVLLIWVALCAAVSAATGEPVATVRLASLDRVLQDVDDVGALASRPAIPRFVRRLLAVGNELKGLDFKRPLSLEVYLEPEQQSPTLRLCLPVAELKDLRATTGRLQWKWTSIDETNDQVERPGSSRIIHVRREGGWILLSESSALVNLGVLKSAQADASTLADLTVQLRFDAIPPARLQQLVDAFQQQVSRERESATDDDRNVQSFRRRVLDLAEQVVTLAINETESYELRLNLAAVQNAESRQGILIEQDWRVTPGGELADELSRLAISSPRFPLSIEHEAAFRAQLAVRLPEPFREIAAQAVDLGRQAAQRETAQLNVETRNTLLGMFDSFEGTLDSGHVEGSLEFLPAGTQQMVLLTGWRLEQGGKLAAALPLLLPEIAKSGDVDSVDLNVAQLHETNFHRLTDQEQRQFEEQLYGGPASVFVGAGQDALWVAMGGDQALTVCESRIGERGVHDNPGNRLATFEWHLRPWLPFAVATSHERRLVQTLLDVFSATPDDGVTGELWVHSAGISSRVIVDAPFLIVPAKMISGGP